MTQTLTDYFLGLHKNMNCAFPLSIFTLAAPLRGAKVHLGDLDTFWRDSANYSHLNKSSRIRSFLSLVAIFMLKMYDIE